MGRQQNDEVSADLITDSVEDLPEEETAADSADGTVTEICLTVPGGAGRVRLDSFLGSVSELSRSRLKRLVEQGFCTLDGVVCRAADVRLRAGQRVEMHLPAVENALAPEPGSLNVVYSDNDIAVINKPAGLTMHPCPSCPTGTLVNRLLARFPQLAEQEGPRPGIVHRLDKDTSGLVIIALSETARLRMAEQFAGRQVSKTYLAVTRGVPDPEGEINLPVGRHPTVKTRMAVVPENRGGRNALTRWNTLYTAGNGKFALLAVRIFTGRTHQIRVHLAQAGFPLWGDSVYGPGGGAVRQLLHAWKLEFIHPASGLAMRFICPPPEDFIRSMQMLEEGLQKVIITGMPGCGKSAVLDRLKAHGIPIWNADKAVAEQYQPGADGWYLMRQRWGNAFITAEGEIDRAALTGLLADTPGMRAELEGIIHPLVRSSMDMFFREAEQGGHAVAVAEVPLWFETGWTCPGAVIAVIDCPDDVRHARLRETRGWTDSKTASVESWQWTPEAKTAAADLLLPNSGTLDDLDRETEIFLEKLADRKRVRSLDLRGEWDTLWS